jgi:ATP-dependent DNA ligase
MRNGVWLTSDLVAQVEFPEWRPEGYVRYPNFFEWREDKEPRTVLREAQESDQC